MLEMKRKVMGLVNVIRKVVRVGKLTNGKMIKALEQCYKLLLSLMES